MWHWSSLYSISCCSLLAPRRDHRKNMDYPKGQSSLCPPTPPNEEAVLDFKGLCESFATMLHLAMSQKSGFITCWDSACHAASPLWFMWQNCIKFCTIIERSQSHLITSAAPELVQKGSRQQQRGLNYCLVVSKGRPVTQSSCHIYGPLEPAQSKALLWNLGATQQGRCLKCGASRPCRSGDPLLCCLGAPDSSLLFLQTSPRSSQDIALLISAPHAVACLTIPELATCCLLL